MSHNHDHKHPHDDHHSRNTQPLICQCDPGLKEYRVYTFLQNNILVGNMLVSKIRNGSYDPLVEYWYMAQVPSATASTTVEMADYDWSTTPNPPISLQLSFTMPQNVTWNASPPNPSQGPLQTNSVTPNIGIQWKLSRTTSVWGGSIIWSRTTPRAGANPNNLFAGAPATQLFQETGSVPSTLTYNVSVPARPV